MTAEASSLARWLEWMEADARRRPELYERLGLADLRLAIEETEKGRARRFGLVLDGYDVHYVGELEDLEAFGADAVVSGNTETWLEMVANIVTNHGADGSHTLNALSIAGAPLQVYAADPIGRDKFFRYAETLQTLFDAPGAGQPVRA